MRVFRAEVLLTASCQQVWDYLMEPTTLAALSPPGSVTDLVPTPVRQGTLVRFNVRMPVLPWSMPWASRYEQVEPPHHFVDVMMGGMFKRWEHHHWLLEEQTHCLMRDEVLVEAPFGKLGEWAWWPMVRRMLAHQFTYRHARLVERFGHQESVRRGTTDRG